jgi:hypothetical protein
MQPAQMIALVDSLGMVLLNQTQRVTLQPLREGILSLAIGERLESMRLVSCNSELGYYWARPQISLTQVIIGKYALWAKRIVLERRRILPW